MESLNNPAQRIRSHLYKVLNTGNGLTAAQAWAGAFGIDQKQANEDPHDVLNKLGLLRVQLDNVETEMKKTKFTESLYIPHINNIRKTITVSSIASDWANFRPLLNPEAMLAIGYMAEIIECEPEVNIDELNKILEKIEILKIELEQSNIGDPTFGFIIGQLNIIKNAILEYPIKGAQAIKSAFKEGITDIMEKSSNLKGNEDINTNHKLMGIWKSFKAVGEGVADTDKFAKAYAGLINTTQSISDSVGSFLRDLNS